MGKIVSDKFTVSPIHLFFVVYVSIVDVGIMSFQREIVKDAGTDSWLSIVIVGISVHVLVWMIFRILSAQKPENADIVSINRSYFGKVIGTSLNIAIVIYLVAGAFVSFRSYLEVVKIWIFPMMNMWPLSLLLLGLIYYTVSGGFQTIVGICLWSFFSILFFFVPLPLLVTDYLHPRNLFPLFDHSAMQILHSTHRMAFHYLGFETLLIVYPFIQEQAKSRKWAHLGVLSATLMYLMLLFIAMMYFSQGQLLRTIWPSLNLISMLEIPLMQRLEYFILSVWLIKILANISLSLWAACHSLKLSFRVKPRVSLIVMLALFVLLQWFIGNQEEITRATTIYSNIGLYFIYIFIPIVFVITWLKKKVISL
ncbi:GerAB/ArcD/ProY family transporter [Cohnella lupini]|uniref:Spore germination protein (Amino acid permease) n=1 Tax=Cohnella lupini TaxID=1294267 RepID=A0A3D9IBU3_9BACL|nr:GerAB/ArcD/ProY family transporter [Cohnella lupini]RED59238.1 spore germination protein (amino acid permease) [Cohnella lupini]